MAKKAYVRNSDNTAWVEIASATTDLTSYATKTYADNAASTAVTNLIDAAPSTLDTLNELAAALGDDPSYATTITTALGTKAPLASPTFTGTVTLPTGTVTSGMILDGTIVNADINASAAIDASKLTGVVTPTGTQTLTNKTLSYPVINSSSPGNNVRLGSLSLSSNVIGITSGNNVGIGHNVMQEMVTGENNVGVGNLALYFLSSGTRNTAIGQNASANLDTGDNNVSVGYAALNNSTGSSQNTAVGSNAGTTVTSGNNNTLIGYNATPATTTASNVITLGNSSIATLRCQQTSITALSDQRDKSEISDIPVGLEFVKDLRPVTFKWDTRPEYDADEKIILNANDGKYEGGFIAQDLLATENKFNTNVWSNIVNDDNLDRLEAAPGKLIPILVRAIQELSEQVDTLKSQILELQ